VSEQTLNKELNDFVKHLEGAEKSGEGVKAITSLKGDLTLNQAYKIQLATIEKKVKSGHRIVGKKIGLTSKAMQELLGVDEPDYGHLLDYMEIPNGGEIYQSKTMQPKVEGEIAFRLKEDLIGPSVTANDVLKATEYIVPAIEVVDSRIANWNIKLPDTIADNASSGLFVLGDQTLSVEEIELPKIQMELYKNGTLMNTGKGSAALGNPATCVAWLANKLSEYNISLKKGEIILSGALSKAIEVDAGDEFSVEMTHLGEVSVRFAK